MIKLGFVVAEFNRDITYQMEILGREHAEFLGAEVVATLHVPGVYDMPLAVKKRAAKEDADAVGTIRLRRPEGEALPTRSSHSPPLRQNIAVAW